MTLMGMNTSMPIEGRTWSTREDFTVETYEVHKQKLLNIMEEEFQNIQSEIYS
jgi:hypothetical protein